MKLFRDKQPRSEASRRPGEAEKVCLNSPRESKLVPSLIYRGGYQLSFQISPGLPFQMLLYKER